MYQKLFFLLSMLGSTSLVAKTSIPYNVPYTVKCYNKAGVRISCDKAMNPTRTRTKKKVHKKKRRYYSSEYRRLKRELALIKKKQRELEKREAIKKKKERQDELRELALQNKQLLKEIKALREAQQLAIAKQTEKPDTAVLSPNSVGATVNTPAPAPEPISKTIVKEEKKEKKEEAKAKDSKIGILLESWGHQSVVDTDSAASLGGDVEISYPLTDKVTVSVVPAFDLTLATQDSAGSFALGDTAVNLYHDFYKEGNVSMSAKYVLMLPTSLASQNNHQYMAFSAESPLKIGFANSKGTIKFKPKFAFAWKEYATALPTGSKDADYIEIPTGAKYEKLDPNEKFNVSLETKISYKLNDFMTAFASLYVQGQNMYADEVLSGGSIYTITPAEWRTNIAFTFPGLGFSLSDHAYLEFSVKTKGPAEKFSLFEQQDGNDTTIGFYFNYSI